MEEKHKKFNLLELLSRAKNYDVTQNGDNSFEIKDHENNLAAEVKDDGIVYYIIDCYNSCVDWIEIDMKALNKLKAFCECLTQEIE